MNPNFPDEGAQAEFLSDNPKMLEEVFDRFKHTAEKDKSFIDAYFSTKEYDSRSPLLRKYTAAGHVASGETLGSRVRSLLGRR
jgi:hypothetical protein